MTRLRITLASLTAAAAMTGAMAGSALGSGSPASASRATTVKLTHTSLGTILVSSKGFTLYMFTHDKAKHDSCVKISMCTGTWPPYTIKGKPSAGPGVKSSLLGTIKLGHGRAQVTYAGHPLYTYVGDSGPGQTDYVGAKEFGGMWYAVSAKGKDVK